MRDASEVEKMIAETVTAPPTVSEAEIVLPHMRGACVTVGNVVHTLFRLPSRAARDDRR